jgi:hypothetical protein
MYLREVRPALNARTKSSLVLNLSIVVKGGRSVRVLDLKE